MNVGNKEDSWSSSRVIIRKEVDQEKMHNKNQGNYSSKQEEMKDKQEKDIHDF